jgi:mannose-1-phosphate guanylyltransferase
MAGGVGERFWPISRHSYPKQLLKIGSDRTMLDAAVERIQPLVEPENIFIITGRSLKPAIEAAVKSIPPGNVIAEPEGKNTAACLALASGFMQYRFPGEDSTMIVLTADHYIRDVDAFQRDCAAAADFAAQHDALVTFGIRPTRPETGYGYIEVGTPSSHHAPLFHVTSFREKPDSGTAQRFLEDGGFLWNSGMFVWRNSVLTKAFQAHLPATHSRIGALAQAFGDGRGEEVLDAAFAPLEKISIDVGIMERAENVHVLRASFDWDDIGTWTSLPRLLPHDTAGNVVFGNGALLKSEDSIVYTVECGGKESTAKPAHPKLVVGYNLKGIVVVNTPDAVLVLPAEDVQRVKDVVGFLRSKGLEDYL